MNRVCIDAVGVIAPGLPDWRVSREILRGERAYEPTPAAAPDAVMLPANERRRAAASVRWALAAAHQAVSASGHRAGELATVFATSGSDGDTLHHICEALASAQREVSPTHFHNSVHNAAAGYWTIAVGARQASASVCGYDASFGVGLVEAASQVCVEEEAVLLVAYDVPYPAPLYAVRPFSAPFAVAIVLAPRPSPATLVCCRVALEQSASASTPPSLPAGLNAQLASNPAARALPLLAMIASDRREPVRLQYLDGCELVVEPVAWS